MPISNEQIRGCNIYVVEDDPSISALEKSALTKVGHNVTCFNNGTDFLKLFYIKQPDLVILDLMLPDIQGEELLKMLRSNSDYDSIPIVIVSAKNMLSDRVNNLDFGADDYIEKPFDLLEFLSRINARLRSVKKKEAVAGSGFTLDNGSHRVSYKGQFLHLTNSEFTLLSTLLADIGNVVPRSKLVESLWGGSNELETRTIDIHINNIRRKINDPDGNVIQTVYGIGYRIPKDLG